VSERDYSIDDLHQAATAEFENDVDAVAILNTTYAEMREQYLGIRDMLRDRQAAS
jgi:hypothetical protein